MEIYTSPPLELPAGGALPAYDRADLIFYNVDHSGPSFTGRVFLNNAEANATTETSEEAGYAGCFTIFGHAGCVGTDDDHCDPLARTVDEFDYRMPHPLLPQTKVVTITEALSRIGAADSITITVVPVVPGETHAEITDALAFSGVRLATYRHDSDPGEGEEADLTE